MIPLSITVLIIFESDNFRFSFFWEKRQSWGVKCENQTSENRTRSLEIFSLSQVVENSRQYLLFRTDILQKTVLRWASF